MAGRRFAVSAASKATSYAYARCGANCQQPVCKLQRAAEPQDSHGRSGVAI